MSADPAAPEEVRTTCPYCGVGCGLIARTRGGRLEEVAGDPIHPVNRGRVCSKPLGLPEASRSRDRATVPLRRASRSERWRESSFDETIPWLAERLLELRERHGPDALAFYVSGQLLTEDYYVASKLAKGFLGTANLDSNSRLCMSSAVSGYRGTFGSDGPPPSYADIAHADCFLLLGTNTAACHPIVWSRIRDRQSEGAAVIVVDPRRTDTAAAADLHLAVRPGTDLALLNAMLWVIEREGLVDRDYVARHTEGCEEALAVAAQWPPERAAETCGLPAADIADAALRFGRARGAMALWSMGANQSTVGTLKNQALSNLCLATGNIGRPGAGPLSLTGQPNAMGGREVGGLAGLLPGYRSTASAADRREMARLWQLPPEAAGISAEPGLPATDLFDALEDGRVRAVWICATNPVVSMPDAQRARRALRRAELVICQDAYHPTETSALAHVVLPAAQWPEKEGTMTNSERRVTLVRKAIEPPGQALPDWEIFARVGRALGFTEHFSYAGAAEVYDEFKATTAGRVCDQTGIDHERLRREGSLQWPCPATDSALGEHPGTERLYADHRYPTPTGRARIVPTPHSEPAERTTRRFPLTLTTGRIANQWHTMTRTAKSRKLLEAEPEPFVELHPADAQRAGVEDGELARVVSRRGAAVLRARLVASLPPGTAFAPFHWGALHAPAGAGALNAATTRATDPTSRQPELKACAVRVEPAVAGAASPKPGVGGAARVERATRGAARAEAPGDAAHVARAANGTSRSPRRSRSRRRLVVVGTGMAALATVEAAFEHRPPASWQVTMIGREPEAPYNRILLSRVLAHGGEDVLAMRPASWYADRGVELRTGTDVVELDPEAQAVVTSAGDRLSYDRLVLATGSRPLVPPIDGMQRQGVHLFRTLADTRAIAAHAKRARRAIVIGGGLLGLEAARGLVELGLEVTVVHLVDRLMETQLDGPAAGLLERRIRALGVEVLRGRATSAVLGNGRAEGVRFASGEELSGDLIVVSVGIRPEVGLARATGLEVGRGILVDDELRTSAARVWAVGECAEHREKVYGVWGPLLEQARAAGASIAGQPAAFHGTVPATTLKVMGVDLFTAGRHSAADDGDEEVLAMDTRRGIYRKLVLSDGRLVGATLLGDLAATGQVAELLKSGEAVPEELLAPSNGASGDAAAPDDGALVCTCNGVSRGTIMTIARDRGLERVDQVTRATRACSGCGSCAPTVEALLGELREGREGELRNVRPAVAEPA